MSLTTNQGLELPDGTDNANVPLSMTQYNVGVENRLVQRYLSIADRTARNPAPNEGELSYLGDLDIYETFRSGIGWLPLIGEYVWTYEGTPFNETSLTYTTVGPPLIGIAMRASSSGRLRVAWSALMGNASPAATYIAPQLNTGQVIAAGAVVTAATDSSAAIANANEATGSNFTVYQGLTPGSFYNAFLMARVTGGTGSYVHRTLEVSQV